MSELPFTFSVIPTYFQREGFFDPKKNRTYKISALFLIWAFGQCRAFPQNKILDTHPVVLDPFEFVISQRQIIFDLSRKQIRNQIDMFISRGILVESTKSKEGKYTIVYWNIALFVTNDKSKGPTEMEPILGEENKTLFEQKGPLNDQKGPLNGPLKSEQKGPLKLNEKSHSQYDDRANEKNVKIQKGPLKSEQKGPLKGPHSKESDRAISPSIALESDRATPNDCDLSPSNTEKFIAFEVGDIVFEDGSVPSKHTRNAWHKVERNNPGKVQRNISLYRLRFKSGIYIGNHEKYVQSFITEDTAAKQDTKWQNMRFVQVFKDEHKIKDLIILETVFKLVGESYSLELPTETIIDILKNHLRKKKGTHV